MGLKLIMRSAILFLNFVIICSACFAEPTSCGTFVSTLGDADGNATIVSPTFTTCAGSNIVVHSCASAEDSNVPPTVDSSPAGISWKTAGNVSAGAATITNTACAVGTGAAPSTGYVITWTGAGGNNIDYWPGMGVSAWQGVNQKNPQEATAVTSSATSGTSVTTAITTSRYGSVVIDAIGWGGVGAGGLAKNAAQTYIVTPAGDTDFGMSYISFPTAGSQNMSWTYNSASRRAHVVNALRPATAIFNSTLYNASIYDT